MLRRHPLWPGVLLLIPASLSGPAPAAEEPDSERSAPVTAVSTLLAEPPPATPVQPPSSPARPRSLLPKYGFRPAPMLGPNPYSSSGWPWVNGGGGGQQPGNSLPTGQMLLPVPGGGGTRARIGENELALPDDRVYLMYNHLANSETVAYGRPGAVRTKSRLPVDRYTVGFEKTFLEGLWSVELRMPFSTSPNFATDGFLVDDGNVGNLAVFVKRLVYETDETAVCLGLVIDTPTGSDVQAKFSDVAWWWDGTGEFTLRNQALHLSPFAGFLYVPNERLFYQGFLQVDVPCNGNQVDYAVTDPTAHGTLGTITEATLLHVDLSAGCWLYREPDAGRFTGLAAMLEFHYTAALHTADYLIGSTLPAGWSIPLDYEIGAREEQARHSANLTVGLHLEVTPRTSLRVAGVFPLSNWPNREFDSEVMVQLDRRF